MDACVSAGVGLDFEAWADQRRGLVERALSDWLAVDACAGLGEAMRYAVLGGGKRLRPLLVLAAAEAVADGLDASQAAALHEAAMRAACAVELIHAYSLVHDDMPCMDNDVLRRGKPTVHVQYGQAQALLAGDALQALAFELLTPENEVVDASVQAALCRLLSRAAGHEGMAGGQAIDLASVGAWLDEPALSRMHRLKTGALLRASVLMGAACRPVAMPLQPGLGDALADFGDAVGLAFQVVDDILDVTADAAALGKTAGKDAASDKPTYVSLMGLDAARDRARVLHARALAALSTSGLPLERSLALRGLADSLVLRDR